MFTRFSRPLLIAHRGASAAAPENTMAAFELAIKQGAKALELDAKLTADGEVVVIHDPTVDRTTGSQGRVDQLTLKDLRGLDAGRWFGEDGAFAGEKIPTLDEVLGTFGGRIVINIELTNYAHIFDNLPVKVVDLVRRHNLTDQVFFSSFNPVALLRVRGALPQVPCGLLAVTGTAGNWTRGWLGRFLGFPALNPEKSDVTEKLVSRVHQLQRFIYVYTVNQPDEMRRLFQMGVDGIFTDDIPLAQKTLRDHGTAYQ
jgi:glycerophosphoryl diester phosphodiesterase